MRPACLELLRCPSCRHVPLELQAEVWGAQELREGTLRCVACEETFPIAGGVVEMLREPSEQAQEEIASIDSWLPAVNELTPLNDDWLIGLPNTFHKGAQTDIALNLPRLLELIDPRPGQRILEVGAGTTWLSNVLAERGCFVVATDITRPLYVGLDSADVLMRHSGTVYDRIQAEMNDIPCVDASFDLIVANAVFHHSENLLETLTEMHRLLRPSGRIVFLEPVVGPLNLSGKAYMARLHDEGLGDEAYPVWAYTRAARKAGFDCRLWVAPSVDHRLRHLKDDADCAAQTSLKYRLARPVAGLLRAPLIGGLARAAFYPAALYLFGLTSITVAQRRAAPHPGRHG